MKFPRTTSCDSNLTQLMINIYRTLRWIGLEYTALIIIVCLIMIRFYEFVTYVSYPEHESIQAVLCTCVLKLKTDSHRSSLNPLSAGRD